MKLFLKFVIFLLATFVLLFSLLSIWLQTESGQKEIISFVEKTVSEQIGLDISIKGLDISIPIIINVESISISDANDQVLSIDNLYVNILPSLSSLWELAIWSVVADEVRLFKNPEFKTLQKSEENQDSFLNPNILIQNISIPSLVLDPKFTGQKEDVIFSINSNILIDTNKFVVNYVLVSSFLSPSIEGLSDNSLELIGKYHIAKNIADLKSIKFTSPMLDFDGKLLANIEKDQLSGIIKYRSDYISSLIKKEGENSKAKLNGKISFDGSVSAPLINIAGGLDLDMMSSDHFNIYPFSYETSLLVDSGKVDGSIYLKQGDIEARGDIGYNNGKIYLNKMRAEAGDFLKTANLTFDLDNKIVNGEVHVADKSLKETSKYLPFLWSGALDLNLKFSSDDNKTQKVKVKGGAKRLNTKYGLFGYVDVNLDIVDLSRVKLSDSLLKIRSFSYNDLYFKEVKISMKSLADSLFLNSSITSNQPYSMDFNFNTHIKQDGDGIIAKISDLAGKLGNASLKQNDQIDLKISSDSTARVKNLNIGKGVLNLDAMFGEDKVRASINLNEIPLKIFPDMLPRGFDDATVNSDILLSGENDNPLLEAKFKANDISLKGKKDKLLIEGDSHYKKGEFDLKAKILDQNQELATSRLVLPVQFSIKPFGISVSKEQNIEGNLQINKNFDLISLMPLPTGHKASGVTSGGIEVKGNTVNPSVLGKLNISNGTYKFKNYGLKLKDISGSINGNDRGFSINDFKAHDSIGNPMNISGTYVLKDENKFDLSLTTKKFHPLNTRYLQGEMRGEINISGNSDKANAKGDLYIGPLEIKIPEHFMQNIPSLNIVEIIEENKSLEPSVLDKEYKLYLDIKLQADKQVYIRGRGVDTQLAGKLHITGEAGNPLINGLLNSERGRYQEFGKVLTIKKAILNFDGAISPSPYLNIVGATEVDGVEIRLVLSGSILNPDISIESTPELPQEDILSKLLFGGDIGDISTFQALQLADGMRRVSGHGSGFDPLGLGRKILRVDDINFKNSSDDSDESSIGIGKHLSDKVYFELERGRSENSTKTKIEVQITPKITIENTYEQEGNNSIGINWRFDY